MLRAVELPAMLDKLERYSPDDNALSSIGPFPTADESLMQTDISKITEAEVRSRFEVSPARANAWALGFATAKTKLPGAP